MAIVQELFEREGRAPHFMFNHLSSKVFLSYSLRASHLMLNHLSLAFVVKHDMNANIREEIANIPADTLVRVMANTRNRIIQCMDNEGRHPPDVIFKTVQNKTLNVYYHYETKIKLL